MFFSNVSSRNACRFVKPRGIHAHRTYGAYDFVGSFIAGVAAGAARLPGAGQPTDYNGSN